MLVQASGVSHHATPAVVTVGVGKAQAGTGSIVGGKGLDVIGTANTTKAVGVVLQTHTDGLVPEGLVQATRHRVIEREADSIVERDAVDVGLGLLVLVTTDAETGGAESVTRGLVEGVVGRTAQQRNLVGISLLILKLRLSQGHVGHGIAELQGLSALERNRLNLNVAHVLHHAVDNGDVT